MYVSYITKKNNLTNLPIESYVPSMTVNAKKKTMNSVQHLGKKERCLLASLLLN